MRAISFFRADEDEAAFELGSREFAAHDEPHRLFLQTTRLKLIAPKKIITPRGVIRRKTHITSTRPTVTIRQLLKSGQKSSGAGKDGAVVKILRFEDERRGGRRA